MSDAKRDNNYIPVLLATSNVDGITPVLVYADPTTHRLLVSTTGSVPSGMWAIFQSDTSVSVGNGKVALGISLDYNGLNLTDAIATVHTKGITGTTDVQIRRRRAGVDADMLSTKITIGDEFFARDGVIDVANDDLATGDQIYIDVDAVHSGTAPLGLSVTLTF